MKKILISALAVVALGVVGIGNVAAQKFELGARIGVGSQNMDLPDTYGEAKARLGWNLAAVSRIRLIGFGDGLLGAGLFFQPEVVYANSSIKGNIRVNPTNGSDLVRSRSAKISLQTVEVPLLLSLKVSIARIQAGPVFSLMNKFGGDWQWEQPLRSPVGYAVGASVDLGPLVIDGRYHGDLKKMEFKGQDWQGIKSQFSSWSVGVGLMF